MKNQTPPVCHFCKGRKEVFISCCTQETVSEDSQRCPECHENLGEETCPECNGTGFEEVKVDEKKQEQLIEAAILVRKELGKSISSYPSTTRLILLLQEENFDLITDEELVEIATQEREEVLNRNN